MGLPSVWCRASVWTSGNIWLVGSLQTKFNFNQSTMHLEVLSAQYHPFCSLQWCCNEHGGVSNHRCLDCLFSCLFRHKSKKQQSSTPLAFVRGIHHWPVDSPHKGPGQYIGKCFHSMMSSSHSSLCYNGTACCPAGQCFQNCHNNQCLSVVIWNAVILSLKT